MIKETGISLKEAIELDPLKRCKLLAGQDHLSNVITRVNIMADLEILNWIEEGEFLLTTAVHLGNMSHTEQMNLLKAMRKKGVEAIAIKVQPYLEKLDDALLELASEIGLPILQLDYNISFADVMEPILKEIFDKQSALIRRVEAIHNDMMELLLKGGSILDVARNLSEKVGNNIIIKDYYFDEIVCPEEVFDDCYFHEEVIDSYFKKHSIAIKNNKTTKYKIELAGTERDVYTVPIIARNTVYGNIFLINLNKEVLQTDIQILESASSIIALELLKKISIQEIENKYKVEFFDDLISSDKMRKSKAIERSNYYKFDKDADYCTLTISVLNEAAITDRLEHLNRDISKVMYLVDTYCQSKDLVYLVANRKSQINVVLMLKDKLDSIQESRLIAKQMEEMIISKMMNLKFVVGIGRVYRGIDNMYKSLNDSQKAVQAAENYTEARVIEFDQLGIYKIFCNSELREELFDFYNKTLAPLVKYDNKKDTELVKTLKIYYEANGNLKKMSEKLFTHYNTVLYRVNRIQEITKCNLEDERQRYSLQTAIKIMEMYGIDKKS
ncbi:MAG: PucR family transcriptional regulator ligand-binding domain-containing protein [Clostridia bacterium]|nr:PucR family transcriptional regulator ligand-binding domain-containing protein [Clostridia bacterium]